MKSVAALPAIDAGRRRRRFVGDRERSARSAPARRRRRDCRRPTLRRSDAAWRRRTSASACVEKRGVARRARRARARRGSCWRSRSRRRDRPARRRARNARGGRPSAIDSDTKRNASSAAFRAVVADAYARGMCEAGDREAVPVGQDLVVAAGCGRSLRRLRSSSPEAPKIVLLASSPSHSRESGVEAVQDVRALPVAVRRGAVDRGEALRSPAPSTSCSSSQDQT